MKPFVLIPARGGSKGIPGKNIKLLNGKPLIQYTIDVARSVFEGKCPIIVSTDDPDIKEVVERSGLPVPFIRPAELAGDETGMHEVILHAIDQVEKTGYQPDTVVLLQPTSPLRKETHILEAMKLYDDETDMVVSVRESKSNPYYNLFEEDGSGYLKKSKSGNFVRRQDCPKVWEYNGAIYIINISALKKQKLHDLDKIRKYVMDDASSVDVDTPVDWYIAEQIYQGIKKNY